MLEYINTYAVRLLELLVIECYSFINQYVSSDCVLSNYFLQAVKYAYHYINTLMHSKIICILY